MANLTKSLLDAISIIANKSIDEASSDETIKTVVKKVINTSEGKYLVNYNNGDFYAYKQPGSTDLYEIDEQVYVLVPKGDMSQKKFIVGKVKDNKDYSSKKSISSLLNDYVIIGDNVVIEKEYQIEEGKLDVDRMQPLNLNPYMVNDFYYCYLHDPNVIENLPQNYDTIDNKIIDIDEESFGNSAVQAEALLLRAKFKTDININNNIGNYGIIVNIAFTDETNPQEDEEGNISYPPKLISYIFDTSKMTGNPLKFYDYTSQYMIAPFDGEKYLYIDSIVAFSEGFVNQNVITSNEDISYISIDDLEIIALNEISAVNGDYKLRLTTPQGNTVKIGRRDSLKIKATTTYFNQDISKDTVFYWGVKDPSITSSHDKYHAKLGSGYRYLDMTNQDELVLSATELTAAENIYTCVAIYESDIILKASVSLYNNNNKIEITIDSDQGVDFQFNEGNPTLTCFINGKTSNYQENYPDSAFSFVWSKEDTDFGTILLNETVAQLEKAKEKELEECSNNDGISLSGRTTMQVLSYYSTRISQVQDIVYLNGINGPRINCKLKNTNNYITYTCSVYRAGVYIGYSSITLHNSKKVINNNYYITITNGNQVFQYDESGIAPNSIKKQEPIEVLDLAAVFHSPQGAEVTPKRVRWVVPQEQTLINIPSLGLQTDFDTGERYYVGNIYPLSIKEVYDNNCGNNQIIAVVTHADGTEYRQSTNLLFTKIGEIGTNGTDTVIKINETVNVPSDECLTIIKTNNTEKYNSGDNTNNSVLEANLYINNSQVLGYTTDWTIAGVSGTSAFNYQVESNNDNTCIIQYDNTENKDENKLDTRIVEAQTSFNGKYLHSFYGIPAIEYQGNYTDEDYKIKIMRDGTLKTVLYDSNGMNPSYNTNQGVHVELPEWSETGYLEWTVESGVKEDGVYRNPNLLLSRTPKAKKGSRELKINDSIGDIQSFVLEIQDTGKIYADNATIDIKDYINNFLVDVERIGADNLLTISNKLTLFWNRLAAFKDNSDQTNIYIRTVYDKYHQLYEQIENEYRLCQSVNEIYNDIYNKIQIIWNSEWPNVITKDRLNLADGQDIIEEIDSLEALIQKYQQAYNDRSNDELDAVKVPERTIFNDSFNTILDNLDIYYNNYLEFSSNQDTQFQSILVEYAKVLITYLEILVNETQNQFEINDNDIKNELKNKYAFAYSDWSSDHNKISYNLQEDSLDTDYMIGRNLYEVISTSAENIANVYNNVRKLYQYYQTLYLNVQKYQIAEESETLNIWNAILNEEKIDLLNQIYVIPNETFNGLYMNNNIVGTVFILSNDEKIEIAKIYVPIIMTLNTYELAALNGWDGTSVEIGEDHIVTPQIGAGIKDSTTNTFTGMVMGVVSNSASNNDSRLNKVNKVGLVGYSNGKQSMFIDSKTGTATFGLPEDDTQLNENEGRIELVPGGVSKIGNWKIGNRFLYNIVNGSYEKRKDIDANAAHRAESKLMIPHDKHGIILSSDQPYIHVKGEVYANENLNGINYKDEYNNINPNDSLELKIDPGDNSLFSIVQHTSGFGDEDIEGLYFGYKSVDSDDNKTIVKNYVANQNIEEYGLAQNSEDAAYYIYKLKTDGNNNYLPYYQEEENSSITKIGNSWTSELIVIEGNKNLSDNLDNANFSENPLVFNIDRETGVITYNPERIIFKEDSNNENYWQIVTDRTESIDSFSVTLRYNKENNLSINQDTSIGQLQIERGSAEKIYKIKIKNCEILYRLTGINLDDFENNYIQFYIVSEEEDDFEEALLKSDLIKVQNNQNVDIELFSSEKNKYLLRSSNEDNNYYLKVKICLDNYNIDVNYSCIVSGLSNSSEKVAPQAPYGQIEIPTYLSSFNQYNYSLKTTENGSISRVNIKYYCYFDSESGKYCFQFMTYGNQKTLEDDVEILDTTPFTYDFILWRKQSNEPLAIGRTISAQNNSVNYFSNRAKVFSENEQEWNELTSIVYLDYAPTAEEPWYLSLYSEGYCTENIVEEVVGETGETGETGTAGVEESVITVVVTIDPQTGEQTIEEESSEIVQGDPDIVSITPTENITSVIKYKAIDENPIETKLIYDTIEWEWNSDSENTYESDAKVSWNFAMELAFGDITGFISTKDSSILCIEEDSHVDSLQGIPLAVTYWDESLSDDIGVQKIRFYKDYYNYVGESNKNRSLYGYIDIKNNNNIYYKYIRTIPKTILPLDLENWSQGFIEKTFDELQQEIVWKEFVRVGLDENGRFFSAGLQDKKTYSRTGKIYGFGKVPGLYGQEIRLESSLNNYKNIIKIFTQENNSNTTYITQGKNDDGSIDIRTSNNGYLQLSASQYSSNDTNTIPTEANYIKLDYKKGIEAQVNSGNGIINLKNNLSIITNSLLIQDIDITDKETLPTFKYSITNSNVQIKSLSYTLSSLDNSNSSMTENDYRIRAIQNNIKLEVGKNGTELTINPNKATLKATRKRYFEINGEENTVSSLNIDNMKLSFDSKNQVIVLKNGNRNYIQLDSNSDAITLQSGQNKIDISSEIILRGNRGVIIESSSIFNRDVSVKSGLYANKNLYVGYNNKENESNTGIIYLYDENSNDESHYVKITAKYLNQLFDWYNNYRWAIGCYGNTLIMRNVKGQITPEGEYLETLVNGKSQYKYQWDIKTFSGYYR